MADLDVKKSDAIQQVEWEMDIADEKLNLELDERYLAWLPILLDPNASNSSGPSPGG